MIFLRISKNHPIKMSKICLILLIFSAFRDNVLAESDELTTVLKTFFVWRNVQTVTVDTCWPFNVDKNFLKKLSFNDISVSFHPSIQQTHVTWYRYAFIVDLSCENFTVNFQQVSNDRRFNMQNDWILIDRNSISTQTNSTLIAIQTFQKHFADAYILPDSGVFLFLEIINKVWEIWSGFRASKLGVMRVFKIGTASPDHLNVSKSRLKDEKQNFRGITLKTTTVIVDRNHFFGFNKKISSELDVFAHMHYEMVFTLSHQLNFKLDLSIDNDYGWPLGNGSFSGLTGRLQRETIDFSSAGIFIRSDRMAVIDYTIGTVALQTRALFRQPSLSSVHNILLLPFTFEVWLVIVVIYLTFIFGLICLSRMNDNYYNKRQKNTPNIIDIMIVVHGAICQQSSRFISDLVSIRLMTCVLFFTTLFAFTSYCANIVVLIQSNSNSIKTIRDIVESPMTFSAQISPYGKHYFEETEDADLKKLYRTKMLPNKNQTFVKAPEGINNIRTNFHGFMVELIAAYKIIGQEWREVEKCGLSEIQLFKVPTLAIAVVKKSGHTDIFKQKLIQQLEVGIHKRISNQWVPPKPSCGQSSRDKLYVSVSIKEIYLTIKVFGFGVCVSLGIFTLEIVYHLWINRQNKQNCITNPILSIFPRN